MRHAVALLPAAFLLVLAGCTRQSSGDNSLLPAPPVTSPVQPLPSLPPLPTPTSGHSATTSPSPSAFAEGYVVACGGRPSAEQVIAVVRRQPSLLPASAKLAAQTGPLCAGIWQYTVLTVTDHEPLQVVTRGVPPALTFVTAGTNVCTVDVRAGAPLAMLTAANC